MEAVKVYVVNSSSRSVYYQHQAKPLLVFTAVVTVLISGFRDYSVGRDAVYYVRWFLSDTFVNTNWLRVITLKSREPLLILINSVIRLFTNNYHVYFILVYGLITYAMTRFISAAYLEYKSEKQHIQYFYLPILLAFIYLIRFWNLLRGGLAVALILLACLKLSEGKKLISLILIILATLIHYTVLFFVLVWLSAASKTIDRILRAPLWGVLLTVASTAIVYLQLSIISGYLLETKYQSYVTRSSNFTSFLLSLIVPIGTIVFYREIYRHGPISRICLITQLVRLVFIPLNMIGGGRTDILFCIQQIYIISLIYSYTPFKFHSKLIVIFTKILIILYVIVIFVHGLVELAESSGVFPYMFSYS